MPDLNKSQGSAGEMSALRGLAPRALSDSTRAPDGHFPVLLALANDESASAAILMTQALARAKGAEPTVLRALGDVRAAEASVSPLAGVVVEEYLGPDYQLECRNALRQHM